MRPRSFDEVESSHLKFGHDRQFVCGDDRSHASGSDFTDRDAKPD